MAAKSTRIILQSAMRIVLACLVLGILTVGTEAIGGEENPNDLLIISHKAVKASKISTSEVRAIFLKQKGSYSAGGKATAVNAKKRTPLREAFQKKVLGMSPTEEEKFWQDQKIRSGTKAPMELSNTVKAVFSISGGISYCFRKNYKAGTSKVLLVL